MFKFTNYLLIIIFFLFTIFSCNHDKQIDSKNNITEVGYILKCSSKPKGLIVLFPKLYSGINKTDFETNINEKYFNNGYASLIIDFKKDFF